MERRRRLHIEPLEDRRTPAIFNVPWADGQNLTISFVPDGTAVDNQTSNLFQSLQASGLSVEVWQREILRAFQTWAENANLNLGVVVDGGHPLGASGLPQGDSRFGDIRI